MIFLDTHVILEIVLAQLSPRTRDFLASKALLASAIVLWELSKLYQLKRINLSLDEPGLKDFLKLVKIVPIDSQIALQSAQLDFRSDPADEIIAATSIVYGFPLMTRDRKFLNSKLLTCISA